MALRSSTNTMWRSLLCRVQGHLLLSRSMSSGVSHKLFIGGLSWSTDEHSLRDAFSSYGEISEVKVVQDRETGRSKGFGFVSFMSTDDAESAKKSMDGQTLNGRSVRVDFAIEKAPSGRSFGGGSMGHGNSGSGSSFDSGGSSSYSSSFSSNSSFGTGGSFGASKDNFDDDDSFASSSKDTFGSSDFGDSSFGKKSGKESFPFENDSFGNAFEDDSFGDYSDNKKNY